eukprot:SAG11_NODE_988_length_6275_cov_10.173413_5_plen_207_part_00
MSLLSVAPRCLTTRLFRLGPCGELPSNFKCPPICTVRAHRVHVAAASRDLPVVASVATLLWLDITSEHHACATPPCFLSQEVAHVDAPAGVDFEKDGVMMGDFDVGCYWRPEVGNRVLIGGMEPDCDAPYHVFPDADRCDSAFTDQLTNIVYRAALRMPQLPIAGASTTAGASRWLRRWFEGGSRAVRTVRGQFERFEDGFTVLGF